MSKSGIQKNVPVVQRGNEFLHAVNAAAAFLQRSARSEAEVLQTFKEQTIRMGLYGAITQLDESNQHLTFRAFAYPDQLLAGLENLADFKAESMTFAVAEISAYQQVIKTGETLFVPDNTEIVVQLIPAQARHLTRPVLKAFASQAAIFTPLMVEGKVNGVLNVVGADLSSLEVPAVIAFANHISIALENARLFQAMQQAEARYRQLFETASDAIMVLEPYSGRILSANQRAAELFGYSEAELLAMSAPDFYGPEKVEEARRIYKMMRTKGRYTFEVTLRRRDGQWLIAHISATEFESDGQLLMQGVVRDVTEEKRIKLLQSAIYQIATISNSDIGLDDLYRSIHGVVAELMEAKNFYIALYDAEDELMRLPYFVDEKDVYDGLPYKPLAGLTEYVISTGESLLINEEEHQILIERGEAALIGPRASIWLGVPLKSQGKVFGAVVVQHYYDVNTYTERAKDLLEFVSGQIAAAIERKRGEESLRESEERFRKIFEEGPLGMSIADVDHQFIQVNGMLCGMLGYTEPELLCLTFDDITHPDDLDADLQLTGQMLAGEVPFFQLEKRYIKKNKEIIWVHLTASVIRNSKGIQYILGMVEDITGRKESEERLRQAQKMESLGILAGGVAHDFNNLLVAMLGQASLASVKLQEDNPARPHLDRVVKAAERASELTQQMLAYSGRGQFVVHPLHLNQFIEKNVHLLKAAIPKNVQLRLDLDEKLSFIEADAGQILQVILNLVLNAAEAVGEEQGVITAVTHTITLNQNDEIYWQKTNQPLLPGHYVCLEIRDDGPGMDAETLEKIFDPFFTTKFTGRGLGLAAVLGIVRGHKGGLYVSSTAGEGTAFRLVFPAREISLSEEGLPLPARPAGDQRKLVLVIDDEEPVREAVTDILELEEIAVITAANGQAGIALYEEQMAEIDLILLDLSMPGMDGKETFKRLQQIDPHVRVILSSGYNEAEVIHRFQGMGVLGFIPKPYNLVTLIEAVGQHLG